MLGLRLPLPYSHLSVEQRLVHFAGKVQADDPSAGLPDADPALGGAAVWESVGGS